MADIAHARQFNGTSDYIAFSEGGLDANFGAWSMAAIIRNNAPTGATNTYGIIASLRGGAAGEWAFGVTNQSGGSAARDYLAAYSLNLAGGVGSAGVTNETTQSYITSAMGWCLVAMTKPTGISTPRWHRYRYDTLAWDHTNDDQTFNSPADSAGVRTFYLGATDTGSEFFSGQIACVGIWKTTQLSDANLLSMVSSITAWEALAPTSLFLLDQATVTTVPDRTGTATYSSTGGTTVIAPVGLTFDDGIAPVPTVPTAVSTLSTGGDAEIDLTWLVPGDGGSAITSYKIYRSTSAGTETLFASPAGTGTTYTDSTVVYGTTYYYKVTAVNAIGESALSNEAFATPTAPAVITTTRTFKRFYGPALLGNSAATLYVCPADTTGVIRHIHVSNPSGAPVNFTFTVGADTAGARLWDAEPIPANDFEDHIVEHILSEGEIIQGYAGLAGTLNLTVDGYELDAQVGAPAGVIYPGAGVYPSDFPAYPADDLFPH